MVDLAELSQRRTAQKERDLKAMAVKAADGSSQFPFVRFGKAPKDPCPIAEALDGSLMTEHPTLPLDGCSSDLCLCHWRLVSKSEAKKLGR